MHITARRLLGGLLALGVAAGTSACGADAEDHADVETVGVSYGQIDLEELAAADPDLIVTSVHPVDSEGTPLDPASPPYGIEAARAEYEEAAAALTEAGEKGRSVLPVHATLAGRLAAAEDVTP